MKTGAGEGQRVRGPGSRHDLVNLMGRRLDTAAPAGAPAGAMTRVVSRHYCILDRLTVVVAGAAICPPQASDTEAVSLCPGWRESRMVKGAVAFLLVWGRVGWCAQEAAVDGIRGVERGGMMGVSVAGGLRRPCVLGTKVTSDINLLAHHY